MCVQMTWNALLEGVLKTIENRPHMTLCHCILSTSILLITITTWQKAHGGVEGLESWFTTTLKAG